MNYKHEIAKILEKKIGLNIEKIESLLEIPPDLEMGDFAFPCFTLSKKLKKSPINIAEEILQKVKPTKTIIKIEAKGPYLNFFINKTDFNSKIIESVLKQLDRYGTGKKKKEKIMIEYSQPNTHKAFHVGHLRNVCIGDSLVKIYKHQGHQVIAANYIGDVGAHIAKCLWCYQKFHKGEIPKENKGEWLGELYSEAVAKLEKNPDYKEEISTVLKKLESKKSNDIIKLWEKTKKWSMNDFHVIYDWIGNKFDVWFFESDVEKEGKKIVSEFRKKGLFVESEGALIVDLKKHNLDVFLVLKSDGTSLYSTKDLALAAKKFREFKIDKSLYVVGNEQRMYFQQLFKTLELMGFKKAKKCKHISYELVMLPYGKMSSRAGNVILFSQLRENVMEKLQKEVKIRHKDWSTKKIDEVARKIGLGALKFGMLSQDNNRIITFKLDDWLSFEGETGPYIQYACARISSIFRKANGFIGEIDYSLLQSNEEHLLIRKMADFEDVIRKSAENYKPSLVANYLIELSQTFNEYYHKTQILKTESTALRGTRLALILAVKQVLKNGLELLGINSLEEM